MSKKILITGAGGYIGRHVVKVALNLGCEVIASDISYKGIDERAHFEKLPIFSGDPELYEKMGKPDILIHMAWRDGFIHNSTAHMEDISKHIKFLNNMMDAGINSISVMGSMHEIGYWEGEIQADTPCDPQTQYGIAKNALRQSFFLYGKDKNTIQHWLRAYYIFGDDAHGSSIFSKLIQAAESGKKFFPFTTGKNKYDFISVEELANQIVATSIQKEIVGITNVCSGEPVSLAQQVEWYINHNNLNIELEYNAFPDRPYDSPAVWGNATDIKKIMTNMIINE